MGSEVLATALGDYLERHADGWYWCDGTPEPRVRDLRVDDFAPGWPTETRGGKLYVRIPEDFRASIAPGNTALIGAIQQLIREQCDTGEPPAPDYPETSSVAPIRTSGWLVPIDAWQAMLDRPQGVSWDAGDDAALRAIAHSLGFRHPYPPSPD